MGYQCAAWSTGWRSGIGSDFFAQGNYVSGDFYGGAAEQSFVCKMFTRLTEKPLFEFMTSRCHGLGDHTTMKRRELLLAQAYSALAHNGRMLFIDAIDPVGTLNPLVFEELGAVTEQTMPYEKFLTPDAKPLAPVDSREKDTGGRSEKRSSVTLCCRLDKICCSSCLSSLNLSVLGGGTDSATVSRNRF